MTALTKRVGKVSTVDLTNTLTTFPNKTTSPVRVTITGYGTSAWDITYNGFSFRKNGGGHGWNCGAYGAYGPTSAGSFAAAAAQAVSDGVKLVRIVGYFRWFGSYGASPGADSRADPNSTIAADDSAYGGRWAQNWADMKAAVKAFTDVGIWVIITHDSDCGQSGTQDSTTQTYCETYWPTPTTGGIHGSESPPNAGGTWISQGGYNYFTSAYLRSRYFQNWLAVVEEFRNYPYIWAYELLSEPLPNTGTVTFNNPTGYDSTWSGDGPDGAGGQRWGVGRLYTECIRQIRQIDKTTPFILGGRGGYNLIPECTEVIAYSGLVSRTDCIYTWDRLDSGATGDYGGVGGAIEGSIFKTSDVVRSAIALNVPMMMQQLGCKTSSDANNQFMNGNWSVFKAFGVPTIWWDNRDHSASTGGYGLRYNPSGDNVNWVDKSTKLAVFQAQMGYTGTGMETAAKAACTSSSGVLFYVLQNLTNVFKTQANGGTAISTKNATEPVLWMNPVLDSAASGLTLQQTTTLASPVVDVVNAGLADQWPVLKFDGVNTYLMGFISGAQSPWFTTTSGDQTVIIAGCLAATTSGNQVALQIGNNAGTTLYPQLNATSTHIPRAVWSDATTTGTINGTTPTNTNSYYPFVMTITKSGNNKLMYINGSVEPISGTADTSVLTSQANTRLRIGSNTANTPSWTGWISLVFLAKSALSLANIQAIERFGAYQVGATYYA